MRIVFTSVCAIPGVYKSGSTKHAVQILLVKLEMSHGDWTGTSNALWDMKSRILLKHFESHGLRVTIQYRRNSFSQCNWAWCLCTPQQHLNTSWDQHDYKVRTTRCNTTTRRHPTHRISSHYPTKSSFASSFSSSSHMSPTLARCHSATLCSPSPIQALSS